MLLTGEVAQRLLLALLAVNSVAVGDNAVATGRAEYGGIE